MTEVIEVKVISRILLSENETEVDTLCQYDLSYYSGYVKEISYIYDFRAKYNLVPDTFDFNVAFPDFTIVAVPEPLAYLQAKMNEHRQTLLLIETFNKVKDLNEGDIVETWRYIDSQCDKAQSLDEHHPMNIIKEADKRAQQVIDYSKQTRIPTGFDEIDKLMYGGLSTIEELLVILARTNSGKSWFCTKLMESAQKHGFPVAYYSPEMQSAFLATRFDTWRGHFKNSDLFRGSYSEEYYNYIKSLPSEETDAYIIEDKDYPDGVTPKALSAFVKKHDIKLLIVDGISYMKDDQRSSSDYDKYKHIASDLFAVSKKHGCAVVIVMQANRETKESKDDKGEPMPSLYNAEGSDHPCRISTQAFALRQIFDKHVLDIKLLKSRMANNQNPVLSYSWDINSGNMQYLPSEDTDDPTHVQPVMPTIATTASPMTQFTAPEMSLDDDDDVEF